VNECKPLTTGKPTVPGSGEDESSGSSKSSSGFALVTNSLGKVRGALDDADVPYEAGAYSRPLFSST